MSSFIHKSSLICGITGGGVSATFGAAWLNQAHSTATLYASHIPPQGSMIMFESMQTASYLLLLSCFLGIAGGIFGRCGKGKIAAGCMFAGALLPAVWSPNTLIFSLLLLIGGALSLFVNTPNQKIPA